MALKQIVHIHEESPSIHGTDPIDSFVVDVGIPLREAIIEAAIEHNMHRFGVEVNRILVAYPDRAPERVEVGQHIAIWGY